MSEAFIGLLNRASVCLTVKKKLEAGTEVVLSEPVKASDQFRVLMGALGSRLACTPSGHLTLCQLSSIWYCIDVKALYVRFYQAWITLWIPPGWHSGSNFGRQLCLCTRIIHITAVGLGITQPEFTGKRCFTPNLCTSNYCERCLELWEGFSTRKRIFEHNNSGFITLVLLSTCTGTMVLSILTS